MPLASFISCCGLTTAPAPGSRRHTRHRHQQQQQKTVLSPPANDATPGLFYNNRKPNNNSPAIITPTCNNIKRQQELKQEQNLRALHLLLTEDPSYCGCSSITDHHAHHHHNNNNNSQSHVISNCGPFSVATQHSTSFGSSYLSLSSTRSPSRLFDRLLLPVAASSPSTTTNKKTAEKTVTCSSSKKKTKRRQQLSSSSSSSLSSLSVTNGDQPDDDSMMTSLVMMRVYESSPYKKQSMSTPTGPSSSSSAHSAAANDLPNQPTIATAATFPNPTIDQQRQSVEMRRHENGEMGYNFQEIGTASAIVNGYEASRPPMAKSAINGHAQNVKSKSLLMSWSKRIVQAIHGNGTSQQQQQQAVTPDLNANRQKSAPNRRSLVKNYFSKGKSSATLPQRPQLQQIVDVENNVGSKNCKVTQQQAKIKANEPPSRLQQQQQNQQRLMRQAVSASNCRTAQMDTIQEDTGFDHREKFLFVPSPQSQIIMQSPYQKADAGQQVRSFFKSKSTAAFKQMPVGRSAALTPPSTGNSSFSASSNTPISSLLQSSPMQPGLIMRDWSSCALAAAAAAKRRPNPQPMTRSYHPAEAVKVNINFHHDEESFSTVNSCPNSPQQPVKNSIHTNIEYNGNTLPSNIAMASRSSSHYYQLPNHCHPQHQGRSSSPTNSLLSLLRAYNVPNASIVAARLGQFNVNTVEQLAQVALLSNSSQVRRLMHKVCVSSLEQQRLADLVFDLVNMTGGGNRQSQPQPSNGTKRAYVSTTNVVAANSSTDSGVYGSDGDDATASTGDSNPSEQTLRKYLAQAQIDLVSLPYSDKFGFGHIQPEWAISLAQITGCNPTSAAVALDKLRLEALKKISRIGIPQKDLAVSVAERCRGSYQKNTESAGMRSLGRKSHYQQQQQRRQQPDLHSIGNYATLNIGYHHQNRSSNTSNAKGRHQHTISQPSLMVASSRNTDPALCDCISPDCVRL